MPTKPDDAVTIEHAARSLGISEQEVRVRLHDHNLLPHKEQPSPGQPGVSTAWIDLASLEEAMREQHEPPPLPDSST
ncbi:MAG: hypothetical protein ACRDJU_02255 [Actinomycetota bacterium]